MLACGKQMLTGPQQDCNLLVSLGDLLAAVELTTVLQGCCEVYLVSQLDLGNSHGDFPGHKNLSTTRGLVIEQYAVAAEHAVGLPAPSTPYSIAAHVQ